MADAVVVGFFANRQGARAAARELQRRGFSRSGLVHKTRDGVIQIADRYLWGLVTRMLLGALLSGSLAALAFAIRGGLRGGQGGSLPVLLPILMASLTGALAAGVVYRRSRYGIERRLLKDHARWLVPDETVLILQAPLATLAPAVTILRESGEVPPVVFYLHPKRPIPADGERKGHVALSLSQLGELGQRLAADYQVKAGHRPNKELLQRLETARRSIQEACGHLSAAARLEQSSPPIAEWILDNEYIIQANTRDIQLNLPRRYYQQLPTLANPHGQSLPRIYLLAQELVSHTDLRLDREALLGFIESFQSTLALTIGELWAYPQMLRIALIESIQTLATRALTELREREFASFWANRLITVSRQDHQRLFAIMAELTEAQPEPSPYFALQLIDLLYDEEDALVPVQGWLERVYRKPLIELNLREQNRQTQDQISISNAFTSLRQLALLDWRQIFEDLSLVERVLRSDPAGVYAGMDFDTRDSYRRAVEVLARGSGRAEEEVAQQAIERASRAGRDSPTDDRAIHVGTQLIGEARAELARALGAREAARFRALQWIYAHPFAFYFSGAAAVSAGFLSLFAYFGFPGRPAWVQLLLTLVAVIPVSQLSLKMVDYLVTRFLPPRPLPKMDFEGSGIPDAFRTLVVVPEMLIDAEQINDEVEKLEIRYLANKESNLLFGLFTDYADADEFRKEEDAGLLRAAREGIEALNQRYPGELFFLFHRERTWSESEQKFIGWERKRGKLEELNRLIEGTRPDAADPIVHAGARELLSNVRFVITLDSDTQLPSGTARRLVETLAHPLNGPRFDAQGQVMPGSYTIIQPRVSPSLPSTSATPFTRIFADAVGIDPYTKAVSDVNQDLFREGSYHGKGIYDVRAFSRVLSGRFPEALLLSHDLIEGAHVRVGLASDIELQDEFPPDYLNYTGREHRWIRGDWQIANWVLPRVPASSGGHRPNQLSGFDRWKIFDNLRRSLVPAANVGLLIATWLLSPQLARLSTGLVAVQLLFQPLVQPLTRLTTRQGLNSFSLSDIAHDLLRAVIDAALLPHQAALALDATVRSLFRRLVSHRGLLEWTSVGAARDASRQLARLLLSMSLASLFSAVAGWTVWQRIPANLSPAGPWLVLWFLSPALGWLLNLRLPSRPVQARLLERDWRYLRTIARRTWRYFSDFVTGETSWLPPDNYQVSHHEQVAMRTSPTNIGLWLLSALAAHDFGYLTVDQVLEKLTHTLDTIAKLERYEGHLLNWYDIQTLAPLEPRYVSAVDSGNLLAALWSLKQGVDEMTHSPILDEKALRGLQDVWEVWTQSSTEAEQVDQQDRALAEVRRALDAPPARAVETLRWLRDLEGTLRSRGEGEHAAAEPGAQPGGWAKEMESQVSAWQQIALRYLTWLDVLAEKPDDELGLLDAETVDAIGRDLACAPSLEALARGQVHSLPLLRSMQAQARASASPLLEWLDRLIEAFEASRSLAREMLERGQGLIQSIDQLSDSINMRFLYDPDRRLFSIGYNVSAGRPDGAYYDLLASEARLGSFVAIAGGSIPIEHWFSMSRPYSVIGRRRVLLSWSGTIFEYLMPLLFQRSFGNTLLDKAARDAVAVHIAYGTRRRVPWGISECAYGDLDLAKTYQYKAFGVPELGLKRGLEEEVVVAPYASLLALSLAPRQTARNLRWLADLGLLNDYGFYDAIDFSRRPLHKGERGVVVRTYMAHHQGMGLLSLANFLHRDSFQRRFLADPRVQSVESLLHERIPRVRPLHHISTRERVPSVESVGEVAPSVSKFDTPHTASPKTQLLSNGRYSLMVTNAGGGFSRWGDFEITRWHPDRTRDAWGSYICLRDEESGSVWSTTYHPVGGKVEGFAAHLALERAVFQRTDHGIHTQTEIVVSPEDDVEIRRVTLLNRTVRSRRLDLTSYYELSMAPHDADRAHPAFNKLFIQTEALPEHQALLACRRPRKEDEPPIVVGHRLTTAPSGQDEALRFETDRRRFIGRGRTLSDPVGIAQDPSNSQGFVLDPILSLRRSLSLGPGERLQVSLILAAGETREQVLRLMDRYGDPPAIDRAMDFAWASAQLELRLLHIQPDDARRFQKLAAHLLYPNAFLRPLTDRSEEKNLKGQAGLWPYGISGDLPIVLVTIGEARDASLVRQMLQAHTYWRAHGLMADLVILNEEASGYDQPLHAQLEGLIRTHSRFTGVDKPGGVFLRSADQIPHEDRTLLQAAASVALVAARGTLPQQLGVPAEAPEVQKPIAQKRRRREPSAPLPFVELSYFNGLGGFTSDGREYVIELGPETHTPAPWVNVIANPNFGTMVSETGAGFTWFGNSQRNRLTAWSNDPLLDPAAEAIYIRDEDSGEYWTPTAAPMREATAYRARHGTGYTVFEHNSHAIEQELTILVPLDASGGKPVRLQRLRLKNDSARRRRLSLTYYVEWTLGESREISEMHVVTDWDNETQALLAHNRYHPEYGNRVAFAALSRIPESYTGDRTSFVGRNRSLQNPAAMERAELSRRTGAGMDPCAALRVSVELAPGETTEIVSLLGQGETVDEVQSLAQTYRDGPAFEAALDQTKAWWDELLGAIEVHTPEPAADLLINRWLLYQNLSCRMWGRSAFYQSGGAFGFRDQLQDVLALLYAKPSLAREHILLAASRQFHEGDVQHWWHPPTGAGIRTRISDDPLWLPYVVAHYVRVTGDVDILKASVPFLHAPTLQDDQHDSLQTPETTLERLPLFEHCQRAVKRGMTVGPHGLPLIGAGDWNDGMDQVGTGGRGESVWLAWFLADVLAGMTELSQAVGQSEAALSYREQRLALLAQIDRVAWDGQWYLRATFDDGTLLGSSANAEARIDSLPQSWAWLGGPADVERARVALDSAWEHLVREDEGLVLLLDPPFDRSKPSPGYIQGYPPGVRENGGQYAHAAAWLAMALARRGEGTRAGKVLRILNPIERTCQEESVWRYGVEPYVVAADVYRLPGRMGQGGWSWYTGSAAWIYRAWVEEVLGLKVRGESLRIDPVIPAAWDGFRLTYRHGDALYEIHVENPDGCERGVSSVEMDGKRLEDNVIPLQRDLVKHRVLIRLGPPTKAKLG